MLDLKRLNIEEVKIASGVGRNGYGQEYTAEENTIPQGALNGKTLLERVILPNNIVKIDGDAFGYTRLLNVNIPNSVKYLGGGAFRNCEYLQSINIPNELEEIGGLAFYQCERLVFKPLTLPNTLKKIGDSAFLGTNIEGRLILPEDLESIGSYAFNNCRFTGDLVIPSKITEIPNGCFRLNYIENLTLPNGLVKIGQYALCGKGELILPNTLREISDYAFQGSPTSGQYGNIYDQQFTGKLVIPESVMLIGRDAFANQNFSGTFEVPKNISIVPNGIVSGEGVTEVIIHQDVVEIGSSFPAWVKRVVCYAKTPPRGTGLVDSQFFTQTVKGVVEVPETSLVKYQQDATWGAYIPSVYRDFKVDKEQLYALNGAFSKKTIVRAQSEMEWEVTHKPDWVTVTPSRGTGKTEITITIDELTKGAGNRVDSLVFKPIAYDYQKVVKIDQFDYKYGNGDVITNQTATVGNGVNIVFMGDCFDAKDIAEGYYEETMNEAIEYFFAVEPYTTYRDYFNVYTVIGHSPDRGLPTTYSVNQESIFGSQYAGDATGWNFKFDNSKCFEYACFAPTVTKENLDKTLIVLIENSEVYGGEAWMYATNHSIAVVPNGYDFRGLIQHEACGHGFGKLGDEYIYSSKYIDMCDSDRCNGHTAEFLEAYNRGWYQNLSLSSNIYEVPWSHMIFDPQFQSYVDMYEGGFFHQRGVFRSEPNSCMDRNIAYFSAISREAIVKRIMEYAGEEYSFEKFKTKDNPRVGNMATRSSMLLDITPQVNISHNNPVVIEGAPELNF